MNSKPILSLMMLIASVILGDEILPSDSRIGYIGRFADGAGGDKVFGWAGTHIGVRFSGTTLSANLSGSDEGDRFLLVVDGQAGTPFTVKAGGFAWYRIAQDLEDTQHEAVLWKITEDLTQTEAQGCARFGGFDGSNFDQFQPPARKLEFIGDSDTAGWCADGNKHSGDDATKTQNTYVTWSAQLARALKASFVAEAVSGIGVKSSWGLPPMKDVLPNTLPFDNQDPWDYSQYLPDGVLLLIGPNDSYPNRNNFITAYQALLDQVATAYSHVNHTPKLISVCGGSINGFDPCDSIQTASAQFNKGRSDGFKAEYVSISKATWDLINGDSNYLGCDSHYNSKGHKMLADAILPSAKSIMGW